MHMPKIPSFVHILTNPELLAEICDAEVDLNELQLQIVILLCHITCESVWRLVEEN